MTSQFASPSGRVRIGNQRHGFGRFWISFKTTLRRQMDTESIVQPFLCDTSSARGVVDVWGLVPSDDRPQHGGKWLLSHWLRFVLQDAVTVICRRSALRLRKAGWRDDGRRVCRRKASQAGNRGIPSPDLYQPSRQPPIHRFVGDPSNRSGIGS